MARSSLTTTTETAEEAFVSLSPALQLAVARSIWFNRLKAAWIFEYGITEPDEDTLTRLKNEAEKLVSTVEKAKNDMRDYYKNVLNNEAKLKRWRRTT